MHTYQKRLPYLRLAHTNVGKTANSRKLRLCGCVRIIVNLTITPEKRKQKTRPSSLPQKFEIEVEHLNRSAEARCSLLRRRDDRV